jgi:hypothetical protein
VEAAEKDLVQAVPFAEVEAIPWLDAVAEVADDRERVPGASGLVAVVVGGVGIAVAWIACGCPASGPARFQGAGDVVAGMVADTLLAVEDAASAPALQLVGCRKAGSGCRRKLAEAAVLACVVDGQVGRDSSLCGGDVVEGAAVDVASDAAMFEKTDAIFLAAVVKDLVGSVALHRWAWAASLGVCHA